MILKFLFVLNGNYENRIFLKGDHIYFNSDGTISCIEANGWIGKEDVNEATKGMEYKLDIGWFEKQRDFLQAKLDRLLEGGS